MRRCAAKVESIKVLESCHSKPYGGLYNGEGITRKVLQSIFVMAHTI